MPYLRNYHYHPAMFGNCGNPGRVGWLTGVTQSPAIGAAVYSDQR